MKLLIDVGGDSGKEKAAHVNREAIENFWAADYFGCSLAELKGEEDIVCPRHYLKGFNGLFILKLYGKHIISAPADKISALEKIINRGNDLFDMSFWQEYLQGSFERYIGPSWIGYPDAASYCGGMDSVLILDQSSELRNMVFAGLKSACDETEWSHSGISEASEYIAVQVYDNSIVSAASYEMMGDKVAHIGIITHPQ